jgi:RHS repeat-associated protein
MGISFDRNQFDTFSNYQKADTIGRVPVAYSGGTNSMTYTLSNAKGDSTSAYTVKTATISVNTNFGQSGLTEYSGNMTVTTEIDLPDGTKYTFTYDCDSTLSSACGSPHSSTYYYGWPLSMTLPTGGQIAYSWNIFTDAQGNKYPWISQRVTPDGTWTYSQAVVTTCGSGQINCQQTFTVQKPSTDKTVYTFTLNGGAWVSKADFYSGSSTEVAMTSQCWSFVTITSGTCSYSVSTGSPATGIQKKAVSTTLFTPGGGSVSTTTQYSYDGYGNTTAIEENNNYSGGLPSTPDRTTAITYQHGTNYLNALILNLPSSVTVTDGGGATVAQTNYFYDQNTPTSVTGVWNHDDTNFGTGHNVRGNLTQIQRLISGSSNYLNTYMTYDTTGQVLTSTNSNGNVTRYDYTDAYANGTPPGTTNAYATTITAPLSLATTATYYYGTGQAATATDANLNTTSFSSPDVFNRMTSTSLPNGGWTLSVYDLTTATPPVASGAESYTGITSSSPTGCSSCRHDKTVVDGLGRTVYSYLVSDPDNQTEVDTQYDVNGRVQKISNPYRTTSDSTYGWETPAYDGLDRVTSVTHQDSNVANTYYGAAITSTLGQTTQQCSPTSTYGMGYPVLVIDEAGNKRETWTDGFGRVIETDEPVSGGSLTAYTCYTYDLNNNLTGVTATGGTQTRSYSFDLLSRITAKTEPESGTTNFYYTTSGGGLCSGDPAAVCRRTDARSITTTYTYDALNRIGDVSYSDGTPSVYHYYDQSAPWGYSLSNYKGRLTTMGTYSGSTNLTGACFDYDAMGHITHKKDVINSVSVVEDTYYTYNYDGSVATITYPSGRVVTYSEGNAQRDTAAYDSTNSINYVTSPGSSTKMYAPPGGLANAIYGKVSGGFAGITESYSYNSRIEITGIEATSSAGTPLNLSYSFVSGNNGNIAAQTNNVTSGRTQNYTYDTLNRLLTAETTATSTGDCWGQSFGNSGPPSTMAADALANLFYTSSIKCSSPAPQYTMSTSNNNQFNTGTGISYDSSGDMTQDTAYTYTYDAENRIITASGMSSGPYCYTYDANGLRVMKSHANGGSCTGTVTVDMLYWRNIAGNTIAETDGSGSTTNSSYNEYIFFAGRRIAQSNPYYSAVNYYFVDHLGSTRVVTNATGSACYEADFLPYGTENTPSGFSNNCSTNYKFTGYERDTETAYGTSSGNDYAFARYYNARLGRFMSGDPLAGDITDPQTLNRYSYVRNNPINFTDPSGQFLCGNCEPTQPPPPILNVGDPSNWVGLRNGSCGVASGGFPQGCTLPSPPPNVPAILASTVATPAPQAQPNQNPCDSIAGKGGVLRVPTPYGTARAEFDTSGFLVGFAVPLTGTTSQIVGGINIPANTMGAAQLNSNGSVTVGFSNPIRTQGIFGAYISSATFSTGAGGQFTSVMGAVAIGPIPWGSTSTASPRVQNGLNENPSAISLGNTLSQALAWASKHISCEGLAGVNQ